MILQEQLGLGGSLTSHSTKSRLVCGELLLVTSGPGGLLQKAREPAKDFSFARSKWSPQRGWFAFLKQPE